MESAEIEMLVNELETRVDRLRALYEQYFMGIERMAPSVPHKDVERRIQVLRKEQIRNTGVRFRFQMILQRYNTYQTHWQRICRQIEEGTYKRHRLRAEKKFDAVPNAPPQSVALPEPEPESVDVSFSSAPPPVVQPKTHTLELDDIGDLDAILNAPVKPPLPKAPPRPAPAALAAPTARTAPATAPTAPAATAPTAPAATAPGAATSAKARPMWRKVEKTAAVPIAAAAAPAPPVAAPAAAPVAAPAPAPVAVAAPAPVAVPRPAPPRPPPPLPTAAKSPADLPDSRLRQIYSQYVQTRRSQNESTATLTFDAMAKSLRESSAKLREKHGKSVDFEVTIKDGKTILKPVVKR